MKHFFRILLYIYFLQIIFKPNVHGNKLTVHLENIENQKYNLHYVDDSNVQIHSLEKRDTLADSANRPLSGNEAASGSSPISGNEAALGSSPISGNEAALGNISGNETVEVHESNTVKIPLVRDEHNGTNEVSTEPDGSVYNTDSDSDEQLEPGYNLTKKFDHHKYYKSYYISGEDDVNNYWVDIDRMPEEKKVAHASLSNAYRRALTVSVKFKFPFYGHILHNVTIATGGFLFTGDYLHKWLAATQYIAPLMANFDTSSSDEATVIYADNGTSLTVQWDKVVLQDNPNAGTFTFQVTIHSTGIIIFAYKDIPVTLSLIDDMEHPVKVGLSDAYIVEKKVFYMRKKTIYEYHKIDKTEMKIRNWTAIVFEPLPLCVTLTTCEECLTSKTSFECRWCPQVNRCSDGYDRHRQDWLEGQCENISIMNSSVCGTLPLGNHVSGSDLTSSDSSDGATSDLLSSEAEQASSNSLWAGLLALFGVIVFICGWVAYAYLHPHSASGQILIKYRPSAWSLRRGEARYTAATMHSIHM